MGRDFFVVIMGRFFQTAIQIATLRLMTLCIAPTEMGKFSLITTLIAAFTLVFINPIGVYINRRLHTWAFQGAVAFRLGQSFFYLLLVIGLTSFVITMGYDRFALDWGISLDWLLVLVCGTMLINTVNQTIIPSFNLLGYRMQWVGYTVLSMGVGLTLSFYLVGSSGRVEFWIMGQQLGLLLGVLCAVYSFFTLIGNEEKEELRSPDEHIEKDNVRTIALFALPVAVAVSLNWFQFQSYRFILQDIAGLEFLGLFAAGYNISAGIMGAFETTMTNYFYPIFYRKINCANGTDKKQIWNSYASVMIPLSLYTAVFVCTNAQQLCSILVGERFQTAVAFIGWAALIELGRTIGNVYTMLTHAMMQTKLLIVPQVIGAIFVPALLYLGMYTNGIKSIGMALAAAAFIYVVVMHCYLVCKLKVTFSYSLIIRALGGGSLIYLVGQAILAIGQLSKGALLTSFLVTALVYLWLMYMSLRRRWE